MTDGQGLGLFRYALLIEVDGHELHLLQEEVFLSGVDLVDKLRAFAAAAQVLDIDLGTEHVLDALVEQLLQGRLGLSGAVVRHLVLEKLFLLFLEFGVLLLKSYELLLVVLGRLGVHGVVGLRPRRVHAAVLHHGCLLLLDGRDHRRAVGLLVAGRNVGRRHLAWRILAHLVLLLLRLHLLRMDHALRLGWHTRTRLLLRVGLLMHHLGLPRSLAGVHGALARVLSGPAPRLLVILFVRHIIIYWRLSN